VSETVDNLLHFPGYPIARTGVLLIIGSYRLLIARLLGPEPMVALWVWASCKKATLPHTLGARNITLIAVSCRSHSRRTSCACCQAGADHVP
jgi:hypothetical protein